MTIGLPASRLRKISRLRVVITFVFARMVISSPVFMLVNPAQVLAAANTTRIDSSSYHSIPHIPEAASPLSSATPDNPAAAPSALNGDEDFTTQAALSLTRATQTTDIINSKSYYDIMFRTSTAGAIKTIEVHFPAGTYVGTALLVEATGIGPGKISAVANQILTYTVANAVNVPANTNIRLEFANIRNPAVPSDMLTASITTRNSVGNEIDGPTATLAYRIKAIEPNDIPNNSIKGNKLEGLQFLKFKSCSIDWGTVLAGEQKTLTCGISDPDFDECSPQVPFECWDGTQFRVAATQHSGNLGLTVLQARGEVLIDFIQVTISVANNSPNDLDIGTINYSLILYNPL